MYETNYTMRLRDNKIELNLNRQIYFDLTNFLICEPTNLKSNTPSIIVNPRLYLISDPKYRKFTIDFVRTGFESGASQNSN